MYGEQYDFKIQHRWLVENADIASGWMSSRQSPLSKAKNERLGKKTAMLHLCLSGKKPADHVVLGSVTGKSDPISDVGPWESLQIENVLLKSVGEHQQEA